ncbi:MAG: rhomboid family intramembrane serine protease [Hydrogenophaga sp.]|uniref:rhomboid family intramembrane serine protease n=1 Tax=Hydrogenophaga sp. TaxID=1904254 RepID=UPI003D0DD688
MNPSRAWLVVCCVHGVASMLLWWAQPDAVEVLTWRADQWAERPWTLWTSAWVHLNTPHLIGNQLALGALTAFAWVVRPSLRCAMAWLTAWPLTQFTLLLWPQIGYAVGLSGLLHAGAMVLAVQLMFKRIPIRKARRWGALLALGVLTKTALERGWSYPVVWDRANDMSVVQAAHLGGVVWGMLLGLLIAWWPGWSAGRLRWPGAQA